MTTSHAGTPGEPAPVAMGRWAVRTGQSSRTFARIAIALCILFWSAAPGRASGPAHALSEPSLELLVRLPQDLSVDDARTLLTARGLLPIELLEPIDVWRVRPVAGSGASVQSVSDDLGDLALWVEENGVVYAQETVPNDPYYAAYQWNLPLIGLPSAWDLSRGSGQIIAIIDSGIDLAHPDLQGKLWRNPCEIAGNLLDDDGNGYVDDIVGWDFVQGDAEPMDDAFSTESHGTHVSGIAGAACSNLVGVAGIAWSSALMQVRVLNGRAGTWIDVAKGIVYSVDNGAHILNLSLGGSAYSDTLAAAVTYAQAHGCLVVGAAGNYTNTSQGIMYPGALPRVLTVAATDSTDRRYVSGEYGPQMDISAPGVAVFSTYRAGLYGTMTGTSMATPHVSGVAALLRSYRSDLTWQQVAEAITSTAVDIGVPGWDERTGWGRLDAAAALDSVRRPPLPYRLMLPLVHSSDGADCPAPWTE